MFVEPLAAFFATSGFGQAVTVNGASLNAIFENGYRAGNIGLAGMAAYGPTLLCRTADLSADPVGQAAVVNATNYVVAAHEPDGTGVSVLRLERAA